MPTEKFPKEKVVRIVVRCVSTTDNYPPSQVTLSVKICVHHSTAPSITGIDAFYVFFNFSSDLVIKRIPISICFILATSTNPSHTTTQTISTAPTGESRTIDSREYSSIRYHTPAATLQVTQGPKSSGSTGPSSRVTTSTTAINTSTRSTRGDTHSSTQETFCDEMEYLPHLLATNSVRTEPEDIANKDDLIVHGVDFTTPNTILVIEIPDPDGVVVRDIKIHSANVKTVVVIFTTAIGEVTIPIRASPNAMPTEKFPKEKVVRIVVRCVSTTDNYPPSQVTLSVKICVHHSTASSITGIDAFYVFFNFSSDLVIKRIPISICFILATSTIPSHTTTQTNSTAPTGERTTSHSRTYYIATYNATPTSPNVTPGQTHSGSTVPSSRLSTSSSRIYTSTRITRRNTQSSTKEMFCDEMEYLPHLLATNSVRAEPEDIANKDDLIVHGVEFTTPNTILVIEIPDPDGVVVRDITIHSANVKTVVVIFTTATGEVTIPIRASPSAMPTEKFPKEKVVRIVVRCVSTTDNYPPSQVTLSVKICVYHSTAASVTGIKSCLCCFIPRVAVFLSRFFLLCCFAAASSAIASGTTAPVDSIAPSEQPGTTDDGKYSTIIYDTTPASPKPTVWRAPTGSTGAASRISTLGKPAKT